MNAALSDHKCTCVSEVPESRDVYSHANGTPQLGPPTSLQPYTPLLHP